MPGRHPVSAIIRGVVILAVLLASAPSVPAASAQAREGATMTVLRGQVAVIRADGSAIQPAASGTTVTAGDEIRTLTRTGALITFFAGTEIELGEDTILVVERVTQEGARVNVALRQVLGVTVNRVQTLTDPTSSYRIEAGGAVALVRGTTFALIGPVATSQGDIVALVCLDDCSPQTTFAGCPVAPFTGFGVTVERGRPTSGCEVFAVGRGADLWNAAFEAITTFEQSFAQGNNIDNPGGANLGRERGTVQAEERRHEEHEEDDTENQPPGFVQPIIAPPSVTTPIVAPPISVPAPIGPGNFSGTCSNRASGGSVCSISATGLSGGLVGGVPTFQTQTISPGGAVAAEQFSCTPISAALTSTCSFTTTGRLFQNSPGQLTYPLANGGQGSSVTLFFQCGQPNGAVCPNVLP